jgi:hypothetical protein
VDRGRSSPKGMAIWEIAFAADVDEIVVMEITMPEK